MFKEPVGSIPKATAIATKKMGSADKPAHAHLRCFYTIDNYVNIVIICTFDASKPLEAAQKADNYYYYI